MIKKIKEDYNSIYKKQPQVIVRAPGRVNIIGRGTTPNTIRYNTGQGKIGVSTISLDTLAQAISKGDIRLVRGDSRQRPPNLYD